MVYRLNDGFNSSYQKKRRIDTDEMSKDIAFHEHTLYQWVYGNRRWAKIADRARSLWSIEYGRNKGRPHINMLLEAVTARKDDAAAADQAATAKVAVSVSAGCDGGLIQTTPG